MKARTWHQTARLHLLWPALLLACSTQVSGSGIPGGAGGNGTPAGGGEAGSSGGGGGTAGSWLPTSDAGGPIVDAYTGPTEDANCGLVPVVMDRQPSPVLLLQDRSSSLSAKVDVGTGTRWANVSAAVQEVVTQTQADVAWGLKFFPSEKSCGITPGVNIAPELNNAEAIVAELSKIQGTRETGLIDGTPTALALQDAVEYLGTLNAPNKYIVLATDGQPTCNNDRSESDDYDRARAAAQTVADAGIKIAVVGVAFKPVNNGSLPEDQAFLNDVADLGGMANQDPANPEAHYYPAGNTEELVKAFQAITKQIYSCTFDLPKQPPSPSDVAVKLNGSKIPRDASNGWEYTDSDMKSVTLHGSACDDIKAETGVLDIKFIMGCPGQVIP